jgi:hypothetical protein
VATTLAATALEVSRVWGRGSAPLSTEAGDLLHAAEEAVSETAAVARAGNREVSTREKALFNLACFEAAAGLVPPATCAWVAWRYLPRGERPVLESRAARAT